MISKHRVFCCTRDRVIAEEKKVSFQLKCSCPTAPLRVNTEGSVVLTTAKVSGWAWQTISFSV